MRAGELERLFMTWSIQNSGYDEHRNYIGLSTISDCPRLIYTRYFTKTGITAETHLRTKASYEIEADLKDRLREMGIFKDGKEISLHDGLVKGHTDGEIDGSLLEIGTVPKTEYLPQNPTFKKLIQSQAYMCFGKYSHSLILFYARDYGAFRIFDLFEDPPAQFLIKKKIDALVTAIHEKTIPKCECGRCKEAKNDKR